MGVGLSEYRAAIGRFACVAEYARYRQKRKWKKPKLTKKVDGEKNPKTTNSTKFKEGSGSLDRWKRRDKSHDVARRGKSLGHLREGRQRIRTMLPSRTKSRSLSRGRKEKSKAITDHFKDACNACKTEMFDQRWQRGRSTKNIKQAPQRSKQEKCCPHAEKKTFSETNQLCFFTCFALAECVMLERALAAVVQMLLLRSGIETNPGPTKDEDSPCCNASQHFNRVKNSIAKAQNSFQSKVTPDTLSKKVIEIEETGNGLIFILFLIANVYTSM